MQLFLVSRQSSLVSLHTPRWLKLNTQIMEWLIAHELESHQLQLCQMGINKSRWNEYRSDFIMTAGAFFRPCKYILSTVWWDDLKHGWIHDTFHLAWESSLVSDIPVQCDYGIMHIQTCSTCFGLHSSEVTDKARWRSSVLTCFCTSDFQVYNITTRISICNHSY